MKTYEGRRFEAGASVRVYVRELGKQRLPGSYDLPPRHDLRNHSPTGFEWGYSGSGPAQLALAICADTLGDDERAQRVYQTVKAKLIAPLDGNYWTLSEETVLDAIAEAEHA